MKLTPSQACAMVREELNKCNGIYIDSRFFEVRVFNCVLQVSQSPDIWHDVAPGSAFRSYWNKPLFTYEPVSDYKQLTVLWSAGLNDDKLSEVLAAGCTVEVVRETATQYVIAPLGVELRVSKKSERLQGYKKAEGVQFQKVENSVDNQTVNEVNGQGMPKFTLSQSYEIVTEESAADGDAAERGFDWEDAEHTFREAVELIKDGGFIHPSCSHGVPGWLSTEAEQDIHSGEYETKTLHPGKDARSQRYWEKACRAAGFVKDAIYWRDRLNAIFDNGGWATVTYRHRDGHQAKGLALQQPVKGKGSQGVWFVWVDSFFNPVRLTNVVSVERVTK